MGEEGSSNAGRDGEEGDGFLDHYDLGDLIGQGAFGSVYLCTHKATGREYAVKLIDKVEAPMATILREAELLQKLAHPSIVNYLSMFREKVFVCIVMEIFKGGDLLEGMQAHWKAKGMIPCKYLRHLGQQMTISIDWLHSNGFAHRDIKGDNYLMDCGDVTDPGVRLVLSDFGTVCECGPGDELSSSVGTKLYWPPEFFRLRYGRKVDLWALGVIMYGLVQGKFPFKGPEQVAKKQVKLPERCPPQCKDLILKLLTKKWEDRPDAAQVLAHPWIDVEAPATRTVPEAAEAPQPGVDGAAKPDFTPKIREAGASKAVMERRRLLVKRLVRVCRRRDSLRLLPVQEVLKASFQVQYSQEERFGRAGSADSAGSMVRFEWWAPEKIDQAVKATGSAFPDLSKARVASDADSGMAPTMQAMEQIFKDHHVDTSKFGKGSARTLEEFAQELQRGASRLMLNASQHKDMVRVVDVVLLRIVYGSGAGAKFLCHTAEHFGGRRADRDGLDQLPGSKKQAHENSKQTVLKMLDEHLHMADCGVVFDLGHTEVYEQEELSPSYPGVRTIYRKEIVEGSVRTTDPKVLERICLAGPAERPGSFRVVDSQQVDREYCWLSEESCQAKGVKLRAPLKNAEFCVLVQVPVGIDEEAVSELLQAHHVDASRFGEGEMRTWQEFADELSSGEATLRTTADGTLCRFVDIVLLKVVRPDSGKVLVEAEERIHSGSRTLNWLPAVKRHPHENQFAAAQRGIQTILKVDLNSVVLCSSDVRIMQEEKVSYSYGLPTVYTKRIITATLDTSEA